MQIFKRVIIYLFMLSLLALLTAAAWIYSQIDGSLAILDGQRTVWGIKQKTLIERDKQGVVSITAQSRLDIATALGFVHAQERFFQMDLLRRNAAGELSSLFGKLALNYDKEIRVHRFRDRANQIFKSLPKHQQQIIKAYTQGVNQGLAYLDTSPFEYLVLQQEPVEWQEEDTILTVFSMYLDLQSHNGEFERSLGALKNSVSAEEFNWYYGNWSQWQAAIDNSEIKPLTLPKTLTAFTTKSAVNLPEYQQKGSNSFAVSGQLSTTGSAILESDMHLGLRIPNTWFKAQFNYGSKGNKVQITGLTLPGTPAMIIGSNQHIAWGFTNSYGDWSDVIKLTTNDDQSAYKTASGWRAFTPKEQIIAVKNAPSEQITIKETIWGPVIGQLNDGTLLAYRWVAHDLQAVNFNILNLETAKNVQQAISIAHQSYIPAQNFTVADNQGNIGWTIMGAIPKRNGHFGLTPSNWANNNHKWLGYLDANDYPQLINPAHNRIWTANARVVGGNKLAKIGDGGYALGARAQQIRDDLFSRTQFTEQALLDIALDDQARFLRLWQAFLINKVLTDNLINHHQALLEVRTLLLKAVNLQASTDSVAYRFVRTFRFNVQQALFAPLVAKLKTQDKLASLKQVNLEPSMWQFINQQPANFLPNNQTWQSFLVEIAQQTVTALTKNQNLAHATWGKANVSDIRHPLANALPWFSHWLTMEPVALAGDKYMPRVQGKAFGASERMIVSPGHEQQGIMHMPTGQSGHPWSPFYSAGHQDWQQGKASPFLPGKAQHTLTLLSY